MKILIAAAGSHGDVLPFVGLGRELRRRGHDVRLFAAGTFAAVAADAGVPFTEVLRAEDHRRLLADPDATDPRRGMAALAEAVMTTQRRTLTLLEREFEGKGEGGGEPDGTLLVGSSLAWATRLVAETMRVPVVTAHLSPSWLRSNHRAPSFGPLGHLERAPSFVKRGLWRVMDRRFLDPLFTVPLNAVRAQRRLAPVTRVFHRWIHRADLTLGMFPDWFAPRQPDWPVNLVLTGFPDLGAPHGAHLPSELERFLRAGEPPVVFTAGTANATSHAFFEASVQACVLSGRRGLLLTQDPSQLPEPLPAHVAHFTYAPFRQLLPRVSALVHHGGIGTTSQALAAGVPQLIRPMGFDQFDNARRAMTLGVARQLLPKRYAPGAVARQLDALSADPGVKARCDAWAASMATARCGTELAADAVTSLWASS